MNKEELNQKLSDLEAEAANLRSLINAPEPRAPEAGDVFERYNEICLATHDECYVVITTDKGVSGFYAETLNAKREREVSGGKNLGKFDEVYVKISDVRDAVDTSWPSYTSFSTEALRKLNIITY